MPHADALRLLEIGGVLGDDEGGDAARLLGGGIGAAVVRVPPASEPAPGSVRPNPPSTFPAASSGTYFAFCSGVPKSTIGEVPSVVWALTVMA